MRAPGRDERGGTQGADDEELARRRAVHDLDTLALAREHDGVLPYDVSAAQRGEADRSALALAGHAVPRGHGDVVECAADAGRGRFAEAQGGSRRRVDLVLVMHLDDLDVERGAERAR